MQLIIFTVITNTETKLIMNNIENPESFDECQKR